MNQRKSSPDKELLAIIERFEQMKEEGKILYLDAEQYEDIIEFYINNKEFDKAAEVVDMALKIHPDQNRLTATRIALYIDENRLEEARETMDMVPDPDAFPIKLIHAELLAAEHRMNEAEQIFDSFNDQENLDEIDCLDIGLLCNDTGFYEKALYWFQKCLESNPDNEEAMLGICENYQYTGNYNLTIDLYNSLIDKDPYSATYWSGLGKSYFYMEEYGKAIEACDFAIVSDDKAGEAYAIKGHACYQLENFQESVNAYKEAWRLGSLENEFAPMFIAFSYIGLEDWDNANEYIKKAISYTDEESPMMPDLLINQARCLYRMDRKEEAHRILEFAQEKSPDNAIIYIYSGQFFLREGDYDKAIANFDKAVEVSPTADTWYQIGVNAMESNYYELAKEAFQNVEELNPDYEGLEENMQFILGKLVNEDYLLVNRKLFKERLRELTKMTGERPKPFDIESYVRQAEAQGKSPEEINEIITALEELNDVVENFDIDQEEDEIKES